MSHFDLGFSIWDFGFSPPRSFALTKERKYGGNGSMRSAEGWHCVIAKEKIDKKDKQHE
ncbi:MAG: hypothetical protein QNJ18_20210 [Xenococcaceae cyanobacterium MO_167.B52]|nr:hypothetical protein [Xenococcaceae cyanobacterium MO_167.B52]